MYISKSGLGDVERAWQIRAEQPIRLAELAQRIAAGEGTLEVPDTPENRAAVANQVVEAALDAARDLQADQAQGIIYSHGATTNDPTSDYQWIPGQTPTVNQALAELAYTQTVLPEADAFQAPDVPAMLAEQQVIFQQQQTAIQQQAQQREQQAQIDYQAQLDAAARANADALAQFQAQAQADAAAAAKARADQLAAQQKEMARQLEAQRAALAAQLAAQQTAIQNAGTKSEYDAAYNAALLSAQALRDLMSGGVSPGNSNFLPDDTGGVKTISDAGASNDDVSYTGAAKTSPLVWLGAAAALYFATK